MNCLCLSFSKGTWHNLSVLTGLFSVVFGCFKMTELGIARLMVIMLGGEGVWFVVLVLD